MTKHRRRTPSIKFRPVGTKAYCATIEALRKILSEVYSDSQATMAEQSGLSLSQLYRMIQGEREPTAQNIGAVIGGLSRSCKDDALSLMTTFLQDVADQTRRNYYVTVEAIA